MNAGKIAAIVGALLLVALVVGLLRFSPNLMMIGVGLGLGGIVLMGSSKSSTDLLEGQLRKVEADRDRAIDGLRMVEVHTIH